MALAAKAVKKVLNPKTPEGQLLAGLATAQKFKGIRAFFLKVTRVLARGKIRKFSDIGKSKEIEDIVKKFNKTEADIYTKTLVKVGFPRLVLSRGKVMGFIRDRGPGVAQVVAAKIGQKPVQRKI